MSLFRFFSKTQSAPAARERLQVLLAHERASTGGSDLVAKLRDEIVRVVSRHMHIEQDKVSASFKNGVLTVTLPKSPAAQQKVKRIAINGK